MSTLDRGNDLGNACRDLEVALRDHLCVTSVVIRLYTRAADLEYRGSDERSGIGGPARGAKVTLMIRDAFGIVGEIDVVDGCHPTCTGRAIREMARIVEEHAAPLRRCLTSRPMAVAV